MSDKNFDQHLKSVLDNLEPDFDPATWAMLEQKMDAALVEEQPAPVDAVDKAVYHTLERLEAPYQSAHWNLLANRLQIQAVRVRRLRIAKIAEAAIILLLLWNTESYWGASVSPSAPAMPRFDPDVPVAQVNPGKLPGRTTGRRRPDSTFGQHAGVLSSLHQDATTQPGAPVLLSGDYKSAGSISEVLTDLNALAAQAQRRLYASVESLPFDAAFASVAVPNRNPAFTPAPTVKSLGKSPFYVSVYASADQNRVLVSGERQTTSGYGATFAGGYRSKKWGVEAGIGYTTSATLRSLT
ncbi:MAG: hypothetical protein IPM98_00905 [Lewinellaceae bacterium]|nr:hypothetical protein [Lewinellaceae bacterium]